VTQPFATAVDAAGRALVDPNLYSNERRLHSGLAVLRSRAPVHWVEVDGYRPFWAVTRHSDVLHIERNHDLFHNAPRPILRTAAQDLLEQADGGAFRTLVHMDDPDHSVFRAVGAAWFRSRSLQELRPRLAELAKRYVDGMADAEGGCDFVTDVAVRYPLYVILALLGLPEADFGWVLKLTKELFGGEDPEFQRGSGASVHTTFVDLWRYFSDVIADRRANPSGDLASEIAHAKVHGRPLTRSEMISYYILVATAGHETTSSSMAGGLNALIEYPDQLARLQDDRQLLTPAVEEMIRWVSPVKSFMRTATKDCQIRGIKIRAGEALLLSYPSANRDEDVFESAFRFDVGRTPNRHLAFGFGAHYCMGASLARLELGALFAELIPRLKSIERSGEPECTSSTFVGGLKHLPIRYVLRA